MAVRALRITLLDSELAAADGMRGDGTGAWQPPAAAWAGTLAALGVPFEVTGALAGPVSGLVVAPSAAAVAGVEADLIGPPPESADETLMLLAEHLGALVVPDLRNVLVLRMDDPGAAVKQDLRPWAHRPLEESDWSALRRALEGFGRMSVFCCPGYVRADGSVVDSRVESPEEWQALDDLVAEGVADLECHGYTHMHPDTIAWASASNRYEDVTWFRELWPPALPEEPAIEAQEERLRLWQSGTGCHGTTLVAPGEEWGLNTLAAAARCGFSMFNSWGVCFLDREVPTWSRGIGSPYLDQADSSWFADCLPQIGYWHDRDMVVNGRDWIGDRLDAWRDCGAQQAWSFADLARAYEPIDAQLVNGEVVIRSGPEVPLRVVRP